MKILYLFICSIFSYEFSRRYIYDNEPYLFIKGRPIIIRRYYPTVLNEKYHSFKKEEQVPNFKEKTKNFFKKILVEVTLTKVLIFTLFSLLFLFIGYQIRKSEEHGNYVRLPSS